MSHLSKIFEDAPIRVQNRNGFDMSHLHSGTSKCGQLVPVLTKLLPPNSTISLGLQAEVGMPPIIAPFYGKIDFTIEGFVVPCSILYGGFKHWISNNEPSMFPATQTALQTNYNAQGRTTISNTSNIGYSKPNEKPGYKLPYFDLFHIGNTASFSTLSGTNDNIYDFMGLNSTVTTSSSTTSEFPISLLPAICYHRICDVFYRNTKLTRTWFEVNPNWHSGASASVSSGYPAIQNVSMIWHSWYTDARYSVSGGSVGTGTVYTAPALFDSASSLTFPDGVSVFSTRQRQYSRDYFTSAVYDPQQGGSSVLQFSIDTSDQTGEFTINSLRMANALQKFLETNNFSGEYAEQSRARWGVRPIDADFEEPHYLGRVVIPVYQHTIYKQDATVGSSTMPENPWVSSGSLGAAAGAAKASGEGSICDHFNISCWSYLMCIASIVPHANYNYGINRELTMTKLGDWPAPELQSVGMEEIKNYELSAGVSDASVASFLSTFGYTQRYSRFKYVDDHSSGELRPGKTLEMYQLQRYFSTTPSLGTSFVTIAQSDLDGVLAVTTSTMKFTAWWEIFFNFKVVMPLADYCIPTLGELGDTHTIKVSQGGSRL